MRQATTPVMSSSEAAREASGLAGKPPKKRREDRPLENDETIEAMAPDYWPESPCDRACCAKSKREASRQFAARFRASCKKEKARLQRRVDSMREDALNWKIKRMIAEDRCAELEKKIAAKRLALRQR